MADFQQLKDEYNKSAEAYSDYVSLPIGVIETQLFASALGDCTGLSVLDLGGGTGLKARQALDAGAAFVDLVDISADMLHAGEAIDARTGRTGIRWYEADVSQPLDHLGLNGGRQYDIVTINWVFDHAESEAVLERMWANVAAYLRPGGRFVGVRGSNPRAPAAVTGKYGYTNKDFVDIPGGVRLRYVLHVAEPIEFEATTLAKSYSGSTHMHEKFGLVDITIEPYENAAVIHEDPEFWKLFLDEPSVAVVKARKRMD